MYIVYQKDEGNQRAFRRGWLRLTWIRVSWSGSATEITSAWSLTLLLEEAIDSIAAVRPNIVRVKARCLWVSGITVCSIATSIV